MSLYNILRGAALRARSGLSPVIDRSGVIKRLVSGANAWASERFAERSVKEMELIRRSRELKGRYGVNLAGFLTSESGVGEAARAEATAIECAGIPLALNNISSGSRQEVRGLSLKDDNPYVFNLVHVNADLAQDFFMQKGPGYFKDRYSIGYWFWELADFPKRWGKALRLYDEVWAASSFCAEAFSKAADTPVAKITLPVEVTDITRCGRGRFGLGEGEFVFLFVFDFLSFFERKNPLAVIKAFELAFGSGKEALLLIKCSNSGRDPAAREALYSAAKGKNIRFIDDYLDKADLNALVAHSDCYVSLHRSEGFGLPIAEAMYLGKPVIATGYSGNMEFMTAGNSLPVPYRLVEIEKDFGPYEKGALWAEPDREEAARLMRKVYREREFAARMGEKAAADLRRNHSRKAVGALIKDRLDRIIEGRGITIATT